jgi:hypothetical protein
VPRGQRNGSLRPCSLFCIPEQLLLLPSSSSTVQRYNILMMINVNWASENAAGSAVSRGMPLIIFVLKVIHFRTQI